MSQRSQARRSPRGIGTINAGSAGQRIVVTLLTGAGLLIAFGVYSFATHTLRPYVGEPTRRPRKAVAPHLTSLDQTVQMAQRYLLPMDPGEPTIPGDWLPSPDQASCQGQTHDGSIFYYFNEWKQESENVVRFEPFALISKQSDSKPGDPPYTVVAARAYVTFERKFSFPGGNPGAILRAGLEGEVRIEGPDNLKIWGRDFAFERGAMRIYSDKFVRFRVQGHKGTAKGVQLEVIPDATRPDEALAISGIRSVKLLQNVDMTLAADSAQQLGAAAPASAAARRSNKPQFVEVQSEGSFNFVVASHIATFYHNVRIRRETAPQKYDRLSADESVEIVFVPNAAKTPSKAKNAASTAPPPKTPSGQVAAAAKSPTPPGSSPGPRSASGFSQDLSLKKIHARGKVVTLISDDAKLQVDAHDFVYDRTTCEATFIAAPKLVRARHHLNRLRAPEIWFKHDEQGKEVKEFQCRGPGDLLHYDEQTKQLDLRADWQSQLHKYPDPKSPFFDRIDLDGGTGPDNQNEAMIDLPRESAGIAARHISLWLARQGEERRIARSNLPPMPPRRDNRPQLDHLIAEQNVAILSPQLEGQTEHLEIQFDDPPPTSSRNRRNPVRYRERSKLTPTAKRVAEYAPEPGNAPQGPKEKSVSQAPANPSSATPKPDGALAKASPKTEPYVINAAQIKVRVLQAADGKQSQVTEVRAIDNVNLSQTHGDGAEPLVITGNDLHVFNRGESDQDMLILGHPGHVRDRGSDIEGSRIRFDRLKNTADVDGAGRLRLPVKSTAEADREKPALPLDVIFQRQMHFDGRTANFHGSVRSILDDGQAKTEVRCRTMVVTLTKPFSFSQEHRTDEQPEVERIECKDGVEFDSDSPAKGRSTEKRRGSFPEFVFYRTTGKSEATGPGVLRVWRHTENGHSGISQHTKVQSNSPPQARKVTSWEYIEVKFTGKMDGDFVHAPTHDDEPPAADKVQTAGASRSILGSNGAWTCTFHDNVHVLYGPVDQPTETVSRDELLDQAGWLGCEWLKIEQIPQSKSADSHVEMLARDNAQIEGKDFRGEAETISYDGSTNLYHLCGEGNRLARLWQQKKIGTKPGSSDSTSIWFNPVLKWLKVDGGVKIDGIQ